MLLRLACRDLHLAGHPSETKGTGHQLEGVPSFDLRALREGLRRCNASCCGPGPSRMLPDAEVNASYLFTMIRVINSGVGFFCPKSGLQASLPFEHIHKLPKQTPSLISSSKRRPQDHPPHSTPCRGSLMRGSNDDPMSVWTKPTTRWHWQFVRIRLKPVPAN